MNRHEHTMGGALAAAVSRMESNRGAGTALARPAEPRRMLALGVSDDGELMLPEVPWVPPPSASVAAAILAAAGAGAAPKPVRDEDGRVVWVPSAGIPLVAPPLVRAEAEDRARRLGMMLAPGAEPDVIREWLLRWSPPLKRRAEDDLGEWRRAVLLAVGDYPGIAFNDETASIAAQRFEWLPPPATIAKLLTEWLAPFRDGLDAARRVVAAGDPEPPAREAPPGQPLSPEQEVERKAAIAATMKRFHEHMDGLRSARAAREGRLDAGSRGPSIYLGPGRIADALIFALENGPRPENVGALRLRLEALAQQHREVAERVLRSSLADLVAAETDRS